MAAAAVVLLVLLLLGLDVLVVLLVQVVGELHGFLAALPALGVLQELLLELLDVIGVDAVAEGVVLLLLHPVATGPLSLSLLLLLLLYFLWVLQDVVGGLDVLELLHCVGLLAEVGVVLLHLLQIGSTQLVGREAGSHAQDVVVEGQGFGAGHEIGCFGQGFGSQGFGHFG